MDDEDLEEILYDQGLAFTAELLEDLLNRHQPKVLHERLQRALAFINEQQVEYSYH